MPTQLGIYQYSGRLAGAVGMKGRKGNNYVREHVAPKNPRTEAQIEQRAKMALAGLLSKLTPKAAIYGLGNDAIDRRSRFTSNIAINATATTVDGVTTAQLAPEKLIFSDGISAGIASGVNASLSQDGALTVSMNAMPEGVASVIAIGVFSEAATGNYTGVDLAVLTADSLSHQFSARRAEIANVYVIPITRAEGATNTTYERAVANITASNSYAVVASALTSGAFKYGASEFVGSENAGA